MPSRNVMVLPPGEGRTCAMGRICAVFKADGNETANQYSISEWWLEPAVRNRMRRSSAIGLVLTALTAIASDAEARRTGNVRRQAIDMVVIHSTGGPTCDARTGKPIWVGAGTLEENMRHIEAHPKLGIHYMIDRDGTLRASVPEDQVAHHVFRVSGRSIAIELINEGDGLDPFPDAQLASLVKLLREITQRRGITRDGIRRHSDLDHTRLPCDRTQRRKVDPGAAFPHRSVLDRVFQSR